MAQALASVTRRLYADFQPDATMAEVLATVRQCRHDLDIVTDPALPELVERLARQRLSNRDAAHRQIVSGHSCTGTATSSLPTSRSDGFNASRP
jgi:hypothetical protein